MSVILYPVAVTAEAALHDARGFVARESEARLVAASDVAFVTEPVGPLFASQDAAQTAYAAGGRGGAALAAGWGRLTAVAANADARAGSPPVTPSYADGRRWPAAPAREAPTQWRLWVSYWRVIAAASQMGTPDLAARRLRRHADGQGLAAATLSALARQPLRPVRPQQPLDIGLFEARRPEDPDLIIPDE